MKQIIVNKIFLPENICIKINKMPEFYTIFARKKFLPEFGGGATAPLTPVSYAYGWLVKNMRQQMMKEHTNTDVTTVA